MHHLQAVGGVVRRLQSGGVFHSEGGVANGWTAGCRAEVIRGVFFLRQNSALRTEQLCVTLVQEAIERCV